MQCFVRRSGPGLTPVDEANSAGVVNPKDGVRTARVGIPLQSSE